MRKITLFLLVMLALAIPANAVQVGPWNVTGRTITKILTAQGKTFIAGQDLSATAGQVEIPLPSGMLVFDQRGQLIQKHLTGRGEVITDLADAGGGYVLIAGQFSRLDGGGHYKVAKMGPDGVITDWKTKVYISEIRDILVDRTRGLLYVAQGYGLDVLSLETGESVDHFNDEEFSALALKKDGTVIAAGNYHLFFLYPDGLTRSLFIEGGLINKILVDPADERLVYIGGGFERIGNTDRRYLVRLRNGRIDPSWNPPLERAGADEWVSDMILHRGSLYVTGNLHIVGEGHILVALNARDGRLVRWWQFLSYGIVDNFSGGMTLALAPGAGRLWLGGGFTSPEGIARPQLVPAQN